MQQFLVTGMSCAACSARVERAVRQVSGVTDCAVNLLTGRMIVEGEVTAEAVILAVKKAGYGASFYAENLSRGANGISSGISRKNPEFSENDTKSAKKRTLSDRISEKKPPKNGESRKLLRRFGISVGLLLPLLYLSMGFVTWGFPLPFKMESAPAAVLAAEAVLTACILVVNRAFFTGGVRGVLSGAPNMDTLVATGSGVSFLYSLVVFFIALFSGNLSKETLHAVYFESAAMIPALITLGKFLESLAKGKTTSALYELLSLSPEKAILLTGGEEKTVDLSEVKVGDVFLVRPGDRVPVDGVVLSGSSAVDCSSLTGESIPVDREAGDPVFAGTSNCSGTLTCRAEKVGADTALSRVVQAVENASLKKAPVQRLADKVAGVFVPVVILLAALTLLGWLISGREFSFALPRAVAVLVISCPCALGLATPVAVMVASGVGAKRGVFFKTAAAMERVGRAKTVVFDKTGTLTTGKPRVTDILPYDRTETELLSFAAGVEKDNAHPLALSVRAYAEEAGVSALSVTEGRTLSGSGVSGNAEGVVLGGNRRLL